MIVINFVLVPTVTNKHVVEHFGGGATVRSPNPGCRPDADQGWAQSTH